MTTTTGGSASRAARASGRLRHVTALTAVLTAVPLATVHLAGLDARPAPHPVRSSQHAVGFTPVPLAEVQPAGPAAGRSDPVRSAHAAAIAPVQRVGASGVSVVGVAWTRGSDVSAADQFQIRTRKGNTWSGWQTLDRDESHGPDPTSAEGRRAATGTATQPYVVAGASQFQVRALAPERSAPTAARVQVIDPGTSAADASVSAPVAGQAAAAAGKPTIYTRAQWGADESIRKGSPEYGQTQIAFVHHTDSANDYSSSQVPAIIRGIYAYHVKSNGWNDIGYNFLVDRFGRIWEGRYGGMDKAVVGAHTLNYNSWSTGVAAIGNFVSTTPPQGMVNAITRVIAWKFSLAGVPATGVVTANGKSFNRIAGHRDAFATTCPGQRLYDDLPAIRRSAASLIGTLRRATFSRDVDGRGAPDLLSYPAGSASESVLLRGAPLQPVLAGRQIGRSWNTLHNIAVSPDFTGDGKADIVAQDPARDALRVYRGDGAGGFTSYYNKGTGWNGINRLWPTGDRDGDGHNDLMGTTSGGLLKLYSGDGAGWIKATTVIGNSGWQTMKFVVPVGDATGDGVPDLYAVRASDGALLLYPGRKDGTLGTPSQRGSGWSSFTALTGSDLDRDGRPDLVARASNGTMRVYYGTGSGSVGRSASWGSGWGGLAQISMTGDWSGDGVNDLLAVLPSSDNGQLLLYAGTGRRDFSASPLTLSLPADLDVAGVVGDVNGDGYADVVARDHAHDTLVLLPGQSGGTLGAPVVVGSRGWNAMTLIQPAGDLDYDGVPDVLARSSTGALLLYAFTRDLRFKPGQTIGNSGWDAMTSVVGVGTFNSDANADVAALRASDHALLLYRGSGPTPLLDAATMATHQDDLVQLLGSGDYNGDGRADLVARSSNGTLWLYPGSGSGGLSGARQPLRAPDGAVKVLG